MIIVKLKGGLGNQLFQYAFGRKIALRNNTELALDVVNGFLGDPFKRAYALHNFSLRARVASPEEINRLIPHGRIISKLFREYENRFVPIRNKVYFKECTQKYDGEIFNLKILKDVYFDGYWQSEKYFSDIEDILREELSFKYIHNPENQPCLDMIENSQSISVHMRRYDKPGEPNASKIYGLFDQKYYSSAIKIMKERVRNPIFFVFSDDINWAKNNIPDAYQMHFILSHDMQSALSDLKFIMTCKHNIIANSSFSWWGAWLNKNTSKIVIAPKQWVATNNLKYQDVVPDKWIKL